VRAWKRVLIIIHGFKILEYLHQSVTPSLDKMNNQDISSKIEWKRNIRFLSYIATIMLGASLFWEEILFLVHDYLWEGDLFWEIPIFREKDLILEHAQ
jgi:hypothetical protein